MLIKKKQVLLVFNFIDCCFVNCVLVNKIWLICFRNFCVSKAIVLISTSQSSVHSSNDAVVVVVIFLLVSSSSAAFQVLIEKLFRPGAKKRRKTPKDSSSSFFFFFSFSQSCVYIRSGRLDPPITVSFRASR